MVIVWETTKCFVVSTTVKIYVKTLLKQPNFDRENKRMLLSKQESYDFILKFLHRNQMFWY